MKDKKVMVRTSFAEKKQKKWKWKKQEHRPRVLDAQLFRI
jgi:hypothetical protein